MAVLGPTLLDVSRIRESDASETWRALLVAFTGIYHELAEEMEEACGLPFDDYEILLTLYRAGPDGLRPSEIATRRRLSRSGASRLIDRLERNGLVERRLCTDDRRGHLVSLTPTGRDTFTRAGRVHLDGIERHVGAQLTEAEMSELPRILPKLSTQ